VSESDSFIEEVTEEVRRDRLFAYVRKYGWIAVLAVVLMVGTAGWHEWRKAREQAAAQAFGDAILAALETPERDARAKALAAIEAPTPDGGAVLTLLTAAEESAASPAEAARRLLALADSGEGARAYRQIAVLKAVALADSGLSVDERRRRMQDLAEAGGLLGLLAEEQLALIEVESGDKSAALKRLKGIVENAAATVSLRQRAAQMIIALGGDPAA